MKFEHRSERQEGSWHDNAEGTIGPAPPTGIVHEVFPGQGASKGCTNEWSTGKGEGEGSVPQARCIGDEDLQNKVNGIVANPV